MPKLFVWLLFFLPVSSFAQFSISGRVLNHSDKKPVANASVFLGNSSIGGTTSAQGAFTLNNIKPGKYDLIVSVVGFETYSQPVIVNSDDITLPDVELAPRTIQLNEVTIKAKKTDPNYSRNYDLFKHGFLGTSNLAGECKILNPEVLDLDYNDKTETLTASSYDFLIIENDALGYRIKYLLKNFTLNNKSESLLNQDIHGNVTLKYGDGFAGSGKNNNPIHPVTYEGHVLFENLKGTPSDEKRWQRRRMEAYKGSQMHFLRSVLGNRLDEEGFRVLQLAIYDNPQRPNDSIVNARIKYFDALAKKNSRYKDSLSAWNKKLKLPKKLQTLYQYPLKQEDIVKLTDQKRIYAWGCEYDGLHITYDEDRHFSKTGRLDNLNTTNNEATTVVNFNKPYALFNNYGWLIDPSSITLSGVWEKRRIAELLPMDYEMGGSDNTNSDHLQAEGIVNKLKEFSEKHIAEKAYLQFDKPYYAAGDTIYFKSYVTLGGEHRLSDLSGVLHVDLITPANKVSQSIQLKLADGVSWGDFALPDSLPKGNYRIRAYTRWMQNEGEEAFFNQIIPIGSVLNNQVAESNTSGTSVPKADIQFFPEGGELVAGIKSKIAFKAIAAGGLGIDAKGEILDNEDKVVSAFTSAHLGMGYFYLTPQDGKTYKAKVTYANGMQNIIALPVAESKGIILSVNNDSIPIASVKVEANTVYLQENKGKSYTIIINSAGHIISINCKLDDPVFTADVIKRKLFTGVATVTLFSATGEPLCERLLFVQKFDQLSLGVNSDKTIYSKRQKVSIILNAKNRADEPSEGHFSVSVVDESKVPADENGENSILADLLLTSDLKGFIEQPGYYFKNISDKTSADLDLVMLTHGYRRFQWKQVLNDMDTLPAFKPENALEINGKATTLGGKPLANGTISLIAMNGSFTSTNTSDKGSFRFSGLDYTDSTRFILQAVNAKGKNYTKLTYDQPATGPRVHPAVAMQKDSFQMSAYLENTLKRQNDDIKYGNMKGRLLKEVTIKDKKPENEYKENLVSSKFADQVIKPEDMAKGGNLSERIQGVLRGANIVTQGLAEKYVVFHGSDKPAMVIVDGAVTNGDLDEILADDIESIEVLRFGGSQGAYSGFGAPFSLVYSRGYDGVIVINSKRAKGVQWKDITSIGILPISPRGFYKAREFYSPKYDVASTSNNRADFRTTIYWQPELITNNDGKASFSFYNADSPGTYRVVIEGIDKQGNIGRQVYRYKVE